MNQEEITKQDLGKAVKTRDYKLLYQCVNFLRFNFNYNYNKIFETAKSFNVNLTVADWDSLLEEAEDE
jgi:hypothetical protein